MPHSSGGGSHGGGFHGGSHHGGSGSGNRVSTHYFTGARRFRKHHRHGGEDEYVYASSRPRKASLFSIIVIALVGVMFLMAMGSGMRTESPKALSGVFDTPAVHDDAELFGSDEALFATIEEYYEKTGICSVIYTVYDEQWNDSYADLETYAFSKYVENFTDEQHFVIVYSIPGTQAEPLRSGKISIPDYSWEAIQGDDTDLLITEASFRHFGNLVQRELEKGEDPALAFEKAFRFAIDDAESKLNPASPTRIVAAVRSAFPLLFVAGIFVPILVVTIKSYIKDRDVEYEEVPLDEYDTKPYSGGLSGSAGSNAGNSSGYTVSYSNAASKASLVGSIISLVVIVPFVLSGVGFIIGGFFMKSQANSDAGTFMLVFGFMWTAISAFMLFGIIRNLVKSRKKAAEESLTSEYPEAEYPKAEYPKVESPKAEDPDIDAPDPAVDSINPFVPLKEQPEKEQPEFDPQFFGSAKSGIEDDDEDYKRMKRRGFE